jgi:uncharacterized protein YbaR (Trm112 family)
MLEITNELVKLLVCPKSRGKLIYDKERHELVSLDAQCAYPIHEGVPFLLVEHARHMTEAELLQFREEIESV